MCTIENPVTDYIFINCFISLTCMQNFTDFHHVVFEIFCLFVLKIQPIFLTVDLIYAIFAILKMSLEIMQGIFSQVGQSSLS